MVLKECLYHKSLAKDYRNIQQPGFGVIGRLLTEKLYAAARACRCQLYSARPKVA